MRVAGIDCSTFAIDIVTVPLDLDVDQEPEWHRFRLVANDGPNQAFDRTRSVGEILPARNHSFWIPIVAVGLEEPTGRFKPGTGFRVQGAVLAMIPTRILVEPLQPSRWRGIVGLPGGCSKQDVMQWATYRLGAKPATQDAADAYAMAVATRRLVLGKQEEEVARARTA